jgi:hypothetical protein
MQTIVNQGIPQEPPPPPGILDLVDEIPAEEQIAEHEELAHTTYEHDLPDEPGGFLRGLLIAVGVSLFLWSLLLAFFSWA